ncbi:MAG TPA: 16S rRNA (guanine(527)-N(7))-methyltransferase RsmG [Bacteroidia bacterium]|nr:16S rRNA (guanine(527)-N(7))-methyltransferase RsmG [Bacteroidia bacterium]HNT79771.1 16S rRNA (guanine(527)-N(7))-methyltransferase RsmG [Bacteroidia bacterium]
MIAADLKKYFPQITENQVEQFVHLEKLYVDWNQKINLVSRKDIDQLFERHIFHSLSIAKFISFKDGTKVMDLGTGGGFPGIPLAILFPNVHFTLVDSIAKKIKVVGEISNALELRNVKVMNARGESVRENFDFIVSRATAPLHQLVVWTRTKFKEKHINSYPNGLICLKGGDLKDEISLWKQSVMVLKINELIREDLFPEKFIVYLPKEEY